MGKNSRKESNSDGSSNSSSEGSRNKKRIRKSAPPSQRSSMYRGVTRHRWTGRFEAHLWDKNCWNQTQSKKGRQVYLGAYDDEEAAAHAYDLAALKYWGQDTVLNFPLSDYQQELKEMEGQSKEEYIGSLRRKSSGFSRGVSKYRGVARHHHNGRWEARIGRVFGNKYLYLGTFATQEEAATAYDMAAIEYRGLNAITNFDLSRYMKWLNPDPNNPDPNPDPILGLVADNMAREVGLNLNQHHAIIKDVPTNTTSASESSEEVNQIPTESDTIQPIRCSFPDDVQTYFECNDGGNYIDGDDVIFGELTSLPTTIFHCELDL